MTLLRLLAVSVSHDLRGAAVQGCQTPSVELVDVTVCMSDKHLIDGVVLQVCMEVEFAMHDSDLGCLHCTCATV